VNSVVRHITTMQIDFDYDCTPPFVHSCVFCVSRSSGKERDSKSRLDYFMARYYGSSMGRFMPPDWSASAVPVPYSKLEDPQSLNLFAYVQNDPFGRVDPDGHLLSGVPDLCATNAANSGCSTGENDRLQIFCPAGDGPTTSERWTGIGGPWLYQRKRHRYHLCQWALATGIQVKRR
jgi:RHS repeat-associated protein